MSATENPLWKRLIWFALIWGGSVAVLGLVALVIKLILGWAQPA